MRDCGECVACCVYLKITDIKLDKPGLTHCPYATLSKNRIVNTICYSGESCGKNCSVYNSPRRPQCCSDYKCLWLQGYGNESDRPDLSLMLFDELHEIQNCIEAKPLTLGHEETPEARDLVNRISRETGKLVAVTTFCEQRIRRIVGEPVE